MTGNWRERVESKLRGQSEVLGVALLTAIVVILVATVALFVFGDFASEANDEQLLATVESDVTSQNITITHQGGDSFEPENVSVVLRGDTSYETTLSEFSDPAQNSDSFSPGDTWTDGNLTLAGEFRLLVIDEESSTVLHDQTHEVKIQDVRLQVQDGPPGSGASYTTNDITMPGADSISTPNKIQRNYRVQVKYDDGLGWRNQTGGTDSMTTSSSTISVVSTNDKGGTIEASAPSGTEEEVDLSVTTDPSNPAVDDDIPSNVVTVTVTEPNFDVATAVDSISANAGPTESDNTVDIDWSADSNGDFAPSPTVKVSVTDKSGSNVPITLGASGSNSNCTNTGTGVAECDINFGGPKDNLSSGSGLPVIEADAQPSTEKISVDITPVSGVSYTSGASDSESFTPATFDLGITSAGLSGGVVSVDYTVDNTGDFTDTQDITLDIATKDKDTNGSVTLTPSEGPDSGTLTTGSIPPTVSDPVTVTVEGSGNSNNATANVSVKPATFDISVSNPRINNEEVSVDYTVENTGDLTGTQDIILDVDSNTGEDTNSDVTLTPSDSPVTGTLTSSTLSPPGDGDFTVTVRGNGTSNDATKTLLVTPPTFDISITDTSISTGMVSADYTVENTGDFDGTQDIVLDVDSNTDEDTNSGVTLTPSDSPVTGTLTSSTLSPPGDGDFTVTVRGSGTSNDATDTLLVTPPQISVTVNSLSLNGNNKLAFGYTVSNGGNADFSAERDVSVSVNNSATVAADGVSSNPVTLLPGDSITNSGKTDKITSGGTYELTVSYGSASASATKKVNGPTFDLPNGQTQFIHNDTDGDGQLATEGWKGTDELVANYTVNDKSIPGTAQLKLTVDGTVVNSTTVSSSDDTGNLSYDPQRGHLTGNTNVDVGARLKASEVALEVTGNTYQPKGNPSTTFGKNGLELYAPPLIETINGNADDSIANVDSGRNEKVFGCDGAFGISIKVLGGWCLAGLYEHRFDATYDYEIDDPGNDFTPSDPGSEAEFVLNATNIPRPGDRLAALPNHDDNPWDADETLVDSTTAEDGTISVSHTQGGYCPGTGDPLPNGPLGNLGPVFCTFDDNPAMFDVNFTVIDDSGTVSDDGEDKDNVGSGTKEHTTSGETVTPVDNDNPSWDYKIFNGEGDGITIASLNGSTVDLRQDTGTFKTGGNYNLDAIIEWEAGVSEGVDKISITPVDAGSSSLFGLIGEDRGTPHNVVENQDDPDVTAEDPDNDGKDELVYEPDTISEMEDARIEGGFITEGGSAVTLDFSFYNETKGKLNALKTGKESYDARELKKTLKWSDKVEQSSFKDYSVAVESVTYDDIFDTVNYNDPKSGGDGTLDVDGAVSIDASTVLSASNPDQVAIQIVGASSEEAYTDWIVKDATGVFSGGPETFDIPEFSVDADEVAPSGTPKEELSYRLAIGNGLSGGASLSGERLRLSDASGSTNVPGYSSGTTRIEASDFSSAFAAEIGVAKDTSGVNSYRAELDMSSISMTDIADTIPYDDDGTSKLDVDANVQWDADVGNNIDRVVITPVDPGSTYDSRGPAYEAVNIFDEGDYQDGTDVTAGIDRNGDGNNEIEYDPSSSSDLESGDIEIEFRFTDDTGGATLNFQFIDDDGDVVETLKQSGGATETAEWQDKEKFKAGDIEISNVDFDYKSANCPVIEFDTNILDDVTDLDCILNGMDVETDVSWDDNLKPEVQTPGKVKLIAHDTRDGNDYASETVNYPGSNPGPIEFDFNIRDCEFYNLGIDEDNIVLQIQYLDSSGDKMLLRSASDGNREYQGTTYEDGDHPDKKPKDRSNDGTEFVNGEDDEESGNSCS